MLKQIQKIQSAAVRVLYHVGWREHVTPHLKKAHWLKIKRRQEFRKLTFVHRCVHGQCARYLKVLLKLTTSGQTTRSSNDLKLVVPRTKLKLAKKDFSVAGPKPWNWLSYDLQSTAGTIEFRRKLKTFLLEQCYSWSFPSTSGTFLLVLAPFWFQGAEMYLNRAACLSYKGQMRQ